MADITISKIFNKEAELLLKARKDCIDLHGSDIRAAGNEVEIKTRQWLERMLPKNVSIGHGHIMDPNNVISPQIDCIIQDNSSLPTLFTTADGTEYTPIDSVYAYGEIKSSFYKASNYFETFSDTIKTMKTKLNHNLVKNTVYGGVKGDTCLHHFGNPPNLEFLNYMATFMFFINSGDVDEDQIIDFYKTTEDKYLPNIAVFMDKFFIVKAKIVGGVFDFSLYSESVKSDYSWTIIPCIPISGDEGTSEGKHLAFLINCLLSHINMSKLNQPNINSYFDKLLTGSKKDFIEIT